MWAVTERCSLQRGCNVLCLELVLGLPLWASLRWRARALYVYTIAAPMLAAETDPAELAAVGADTRGTLEALAAGRTDPVAAAERWARS